PSPGRGTGPAFEPTAAGAGPRPRGAPAFFSLTAARRSERRAHGLTLVLPAAIAPPVVPRQEVPGDQPEHGAVRLLHGTGQPSPSRPLSVAAGEDPQQRLVLAHHVDLAAGDHGPVGPILGRDR